MNTDTGRTLACAQCGAVFGCNLEGGCWCAAEPYRLPLPVNKAQDCLCPDCLRRLAAAQARQADGPLAGP